MKKGIWMDDPEEHDHPAAQDYLELLFEPPAAATMAAIIVYAPAII